MKISVLKYLAVICLLVTLLESNRIPVISVFSMHLQIAHQGDDSSAENPVKESETQMESVKDYLHQFTAFNFSQPVFSFAVKHPVFVKTKFPYCFYPDVLTPPPNC